MNDRPREATPDLAGSMIGAWSKFFSSMADAMGADPWEATPPAAARRTRSALFASWAEYWNGALRSTEFLEAMQRGLSTAVQARSGYNEALTHAYRELQLPSCQDVDDLAGAVGRLNRRLGDDMETIVTRLDDLEAEIARLKARLGGEPEHGGPPQGAAQNGNPGPKRPRKNRSRAP